MSTKLKEPELVILRRQAHEQNASSGQFVDPHLIAQCTNALRRRGEAWAAAVLGRDLSRRSIAVPAMPYLLDHEPLMLVLADRAEDVVTLNEFEE